MNNGIKVDGEDVVDPRTTIKDVGLLEAIFTQSNWSGTVSRESWYGKHGPWRRILHFVVLTSWAWTLSMYISLCYFQVFPGTDETINIPILLATTDSELQAIKETHFECLAALCEEIGRGVEVDCVVNEDGTTGRVEFGEDVPEQIFFPQACHDATEATFGYPYLNGDESLGKKPIAFITLQQEKDDHKRHDNETTIPTSQSSILTLLPECNVIVNPSPGLSEQEMDAIRQQLNIDDSEWDNLFSDLNNPDQPNNNDYNMDLGGFMMLDLLSMSHQKKQFTPGHRETRVLKKLFCPDEMSEEIQQKVIPFVSDTYDFLLDNRFEILTVILFFTRTCVATTFLFWLMFRLVIPAFLMKRLLRWPTHSTISFRDIWRTLLVLCMVSDLRLNSPALSAILAVGAWYYGDSTAAMEWTFLGMLAWGADDTVFPWLDSLVKGMVIPGNKMWKSLIHVVVVGEGWWKLVTVYVVFKAYQTLNLTLTRKRNALEQTYLQLDRPGEHAHID